MKLDILLLPSPRSCRLFVAAPVLDPPVQPAPERADPAREWPRRYRLLPRLASISMQNEYVPTHFVES
ncbi:MAG: hypothetical protein ACREE5_02950, partial [Acetobacteraceae bacterium]